MSQDIPKTYDARAVENYWYSRWESNGFFAPDPDGEELPYSIVMPPPNVTGSLHMGHALNLTLQDILIRWTRMRGRRVLWLPGTDHAGIATQNVVERQLANEGLHRNDLGREAFEKRVWEWKEISESRILNQIRRLGCSCDWSRTRFTMDEGLSQAVREVFVSLYRDGLIYQGEYLVNWCPRCSTAISDLEVEHQPLAGKLWHLKYPLLDGSGHMIVSTTRPETMLGDTGVAVHPDDERYHDLVGQRVRLPLMDREIPIIGDSFVDKEFGSGAVKVTPGHDPNDFAAGKRHGLPIVKVIGEDGTMTSAAGPYAGLDRYEARERVLADLEGQGLISGVDEHQHNVGRCQRCDTVVEYLVSRQWFVSVKPLAEAAISAVEAGQTEFVPQRYQKIFFEWMRNIHDWCISRQLWWGHRIPAWHCGSCQKITVGVETPTACEHCGSGELQQEKDVLDTWFSSGLWPFSTLGWPQKTADLATFYPTSVLVTAFDIIFFWVARMMMLGLRFRDEVPFRKVHINGMVRDEQGKKMSKSRGNVIDPLKLIDEYGSDAIRFTLSVMAVPGTDIPFSMSRMSGYRAFCNKIWNAGRFLLMNLQEEKSPSSKDAVQDLWDQGRLGLEDYWILGRLQQVIESTNQNLERFRFHEASHELYHFFWDEFCSWYIEFIKGDLGGDDEAARSKARTVALFLLDSALRLLHPFIPFVTEELWQRLPHDGETLMRATFPTAELAWIRPPAIDDMQGIQELISAIRTARAENQVPPRRVVPCRLACGPEDRSKIEAQMHHLRSLARVEPVEFEAGEEASGNRLQVQGVASLGRFTLFLEGVIDVDAERGRIQRQVDKLEKDLVQLDRKLSNENFTNRAPADVVAGVRLRHNQLTEKVIALKKQLDGFS